MYILSAIAILFRLFTRRFGKLDLYDKHRRVGYWLVQRRTGKGLSRWTGTEWRTADGNIHDLRPMKPIKFLSKH